MKINRLKRIFAFTLMACLSVGTYAMNAYDYAGEDGVLDTRFFWARFEAETGGVHMQNCIMLNYNGWGYQGLYGSNHYLSISESASRFGLKVYTEKGYYKGIVTSGSDIWGSRSIGIETNGSPDYPTQDLPYDESEGRSTNYWIRMHDYYAPVGQSVINQALTGDEQYLLYRYSGLWGSNINSDIDFEQEIIVSLTENRPAFSGAPVLEMYNGVPTVVFSYARGEGDGSYSDWTEYGTYSLLDVNDRLIDNQQAPASQSSGTFRIQYRPFDQQAKIQHSYSPQYSGVTYTSTTDLYYLPLAFQPSYVSLIPDSVGRRVKIKLDVDDYRSSSIYTTSSDRFVVKLYSSYIDGKQHEVHDSVVYRFDLQAKNWTQDVQVPYLVDSVQYSVVAYREFTSSPKLIVRDSSALQAYYTKTNTLTYNFHHSAATNLRTVSDAQSVCRYIDWNVTGTVWSPGTVAELHAYDQTVPSESYVTKIRRRADFMAGRTTNFHLQSCHTYAFRMIVRPGSNAYPVTQTDITDEVTQLLEPKIYSFEASQGELTDQVRVRFRADDFTYFVLQRQQVGDTLWHTISTSESTVVGDLYTVNDLGAQSGLVYRYRLIGVSDCGKERMQITTLQNQRPIEDYGFRNPRGSVYGRVTYEDGTSVDSVMIRMVPTGRTERYCLHFDHADAVSLGEHALVQQLPMTVHLLAKGSAQTNGTLMHIPGFADILYSNGVPMATVSSEPKHSLEFVPTDSTSRPDIPILDEDEELIGRVDSIPWDTTRVPEVGDYHAMTLVMDTEYAYIYCDGQLVTRDLIPRRDDGSLAIGTPGIIQVGKEWIGDLDEIRIYSRALDSTEVADSYNRILTGKEDGLEAYYLFDFGTEGHYYDQSYTEDNANGDHYHRHHGDYVGVAGVERRKTTLTDEMLSYSTRTAADGSYMIANVPYQGNGTAYTVTPIKGVHQFRPQQKVIFLSSSAAQHTVDFTDVSTFNVPIQVVYQGGNYPVEDVEFEIDGQQVITPTGIVKTDADGKATLRVPIGVHRVQAKKDGHGFLDDGYLLDVHGNDINYVEHMAQTTLVDTTRVLLIGRVAGGRIQDDYEVGFGLSQNNLSNYSTITLEPSLSYKYQLTDTAYRDSVHHHGLLRDTLVYSYQVAYDSINAHSYRVLDNNNHHTWTHTQPEQVVIHVDSTTGEFYARVFPIRYNVSIQVPGYSQQLVDAIEGNHQQLDLMSAIDGATTSVLSAKGDTILSSDTVERRHFTDLTVDTLWQGTVVALDYADSIRCAAIQKYILRKNAQLTVVQVEGGTEVGYYGDSVLITQRTMDNKRDTVQMWNGQQYLFGLPILEESTPYFWLLRMSENYVHTEHGTVDYVGCENVKYTISNATQENTIFSISGDSLSGEGYYKFEPRVADMATGQQQIAIRATYGRGDTQQEAFWYPPFSTNTDANFFFLGERKKGHDFVTRGPDQILCVLRDPPGSSSYTYLKQGTTFTYTDSHKGLEEVKTFLGGGVEGALQQSGTATALNQWQNKYQHDFAGQENAYGKHAYTRTVTTTIGYQTSNSPDQVGAMADVYIGESTNIIYGSADYIALVDSGYYKTVSAISPIYHQPMVYTATDQPWLLMQVEVPSVEQKINTTFAYTQRQIIEQEIPKLKQLRDHSMLYPAVDMDKDSTSYVRMRDSLRSIVDADTIRPLVYYLSHYASPEHAKHARIDTLKNKENKDSIVYRYDIIYNPVPFTLCETAEDGQWVTKNTIPDDVQDYNIAVLNWERQIRKNEKAKYEVIGNEDNRLHNYSFDAASYISYDAKYATTIEFQNLVSVRFGAKNARGYNTVSTGFQEELEIMTGYDAEITTSATRSHNIGFVLSDGNAGDYYTVDVYHEKDWKKDKEQYEIDHAGGNVTLDELKAKGNYGSFIFHTVAGATSCPCELADTALYYADSIGPVELNAATVQRIKPYLEVLTPNIMDVPSGDPAYVRVRLHNLSEDDSRMQYSFGLDNDSNPDGLQVMMDGQSLAAGVKLVIPGGVNGYIDKTLIVTRGNAMHYEDVKLCMADVCGTSNHISSTAAFSVHFVPGCSQAEILQPAGAWTYNTMLPTTVVTDPVDQTTTTQHYMTIQIGGFNVQYENFSYLALQRKLVSEGDDQWLTLRRWTYDEIVADQATTLSYDMMMDGYDDGQYELRAICVCGTGSDAVITPSAVRAGIKDMTCPRQYGLCQPASGFLTAADRISIRFNEPIAEGRITDNNITVQGILSGSDRGVQGTYVSLDGRSAYLQTELAHNLADRSFTMEGTVLMRNWSEAPLFSHCDGQQSVELGILPNHHLQVRFNNQVYTSERPCNAEEGIFNHYALVYDTLTHTLMAYCNAECVISQQVGGLYRSTGQLQIGHCPHTPDQYLYADVATFRLWNYAMDPADMQLMRNRRLDGNEYNLLACYDMSEGYGSVVADRSRGVNLMMQGNAQWTLPSGYSLELSQTSPQYAALDMTRVGVSDQSDWTLQLWMRSEADQINAVVLTTGIGDGVDNQLTIGLDDKGRLYYQSNTDRYTCPALCNDGQWHCVAIAVSRSMAYARFYLDGVLQGFSESSTFAAPQGWLYVGVQPTIGMDESMTLDHYFRGQVDEIQWWNLYRHQSQMEDEYRLRRTIGEPGLRGYWPMQQFVTHQGRQEMDTTLCNVADLSGQTDLSYHVGSADFAQSPAPTNQALARDHLNFNFTTTRDGLQIDLLDEPQRLENTEVTVTVDGIYDLNGNPMTSPVTWKLSVQQARAGWVVPSQQLQMTYDQPLSFRNTLYNASGSSAPYQIYGLPSWLSVDAPEGELKAGSREVVTFTIDAGLAIGTYTEVIYLQTQDDIIKPLHLTLTVRGPEPDWHEAYPTSSTTLSIFAQMQIDNELSHDENDILAVYLDGECVGVAHTQYVRQLDMYYVLMTVHLPNGAISDKSLTFMMYRAANGRIYEGVPETILYARADAIYGSPTHPVRMVGSQVQYVHYDLDKTGWHWISFPIQSNLLTNVPSLLGTSGWDGDDELKSLTQNTKYNRAGHQWLGELQSVNSDQMYMLYVHSPKHFFLPGQTINPQQHPLTIQPGWNWISYLPQTNLMLQQALAGYQAHNGDVIKGSDGFSMYVAEVGQWVGSLGYMSPACGYMLYNSTSDTQTLTYPSDASTVMHAPRPATTIAPHSMSLFVRPVEGMQQLMLICSDQQIMPVMVDYQGEQLCVFQVSSYGEPALRFRVLTDDGEAESVDEIYYQANQVLGTPDQPVCLHFGALDDDTDTQMYTILGQPVNEPAQTGVYVGKNKKIFSK